MDYDKLEKAIREAEKFLTTAYGFRHYQTDSQAVKDLSNLRISISDLTRALAELRKG